MKNTNKGNAAVWLLVLVVLGIGAYFIFRDKTPESVNTPQSAISGAQKTVVEGVVVCLPHRDTSGPTTMECSYGIKTDAGDHYALDMTNSKNTEPIEVTDRISVEGDVIPENDNTRNWTKIYNIKGILAVSDHWEYRDK